MYQFALVASCCWLGRSYSQRPLTRASHPDCTILVTLVLAKVEQLEDVERAFVHVDYVSRDYYEHVVSREDDALVRYFKHDYGTGPASPCHPPTFVIDP